MSLLNIFTIFL